VGGAIGKKPIHFKVGFLAFFVELPKKSIHASHPFRQQFVIAKHRYFFQHKYIYFKL